MKKLTYNDVIKEFRKNPINHDAQHKDVLGVEEARINKLHTLEIDPTSDNIIDKFILTNGVNKLRNLKVWCMKSDNSRMFEGWITHVLPIRVLLVKTDKKTLPMEFSSVISLGT